jgi:hypothetical protein
MKVKRGGSDPMRPFIAKDSCQPLLRSLIGRCWAEDPQQRPSFDVIKSTIGKIHGSVTLFQFAHKVFDSMCSGKEKSLLETLLTRMEVYANNLESIVAERTSLLAQEQEKTEQLLLQILPQYGLLLLQCNLLMLYYMEPCRAIVTFCRLLPFLHACTLHFINANRLIHTIQCINRKTFRELA